MKAEQPDKTPPETQSTGSRSAARRPLFVAGLLAGCLCVLLYSERPGGADSSAALADVPAPRAPGTPSGPPRHSESPAPPRTEDSDEPDYLRFVPGKSVGEGELQTALVTMVGDGGVRVDLISVVHVADGTYYRGLQKRFEAYDSLLYEMVKDEDVKPVAGEGGGLLTFFQRSLKDLLALEFQLDAIDYTKKNFVHADLDPDTFFRLQKERGESLLSLMFKVLRADLLARQKDSKSPQIGLLQIALALSSDDSARALKYLLAQQMENMEAIIAGIEDTPSGEGSVIVAERNKKALAVLRQRLDRGEKKIGIFYGGAHMPDMEERLRRKFKLRRAGVEWLAAWSIRRKPEKSKQPGWLERFGSPGRSDRPSEDGDRRPDGKQDR